METVQILNSNKVKVSDYRDLRLRALKEEPHAFASTHASQKDDSDEIWGERLKRYQEENGNWMVFAAISQKLVGMLGAYQTKEDIKTNAANIIAVYVAPEVRGKGISKLLMERVLQKLKASKIITVKLSVNTSQTAALRLYERFGFSNIGKENKKLGDGQMHDEYLMEKDLRIDL